MKQSTFSVSGEVSPALVCLIILGIAFLYGTMFALGRLAAKRRHDQSMTTDELQARIAKDVTDEDIDRLLPTSLRKDVPPEWQGAFARARARKGQVRK